jgi:hypothetical protein
MSTSNIQDLQERNDQLLNNISQLQKEEQSLYDQLNSSSLTPEEKQSLINQINELSQIRFNLYSSMKDILSGYQENTTNSQNTFIQQAVAIKIIEEQLNKNKLGLNALEAQKQNKLKLVEINTYYGKRYNTYKHLMKTIVLFCIPIVILTYIYNTDLLPGRLYAFIVGIIIIFALFVIGYQLIDISNRDNMNWDEYNWYFNKSTAPVDSSTGNEKNPWSNPTITCIGAECCTNGSVYDSSLNKCVSDGTCSKTNSSSLTEPMISGVLGKYGFTLVRPVATIKEDIKPANSVKNLYEEL